LYLRLQNHTRVSIDFRSVTIDAFIRYEERGIRRVTRPNVARTPIQLTIGDDAYYEVIKLKDYKLSESESCGRRKIEEEGEGEERRFLKQKFQMRKLLSLTESET